ncbi:DUF1501 domain-containing protein [Acidipila sp. EB88]|uniref:DUF1501 domain-containing protein n=1 Tax=Acidipila sp. EB88 TaxID=2305226 RepID=UPI000F5EACA2|nr:DUF1501 domain-containing protein [Acidipila sp. EB88]RRA47785.1 DUF1501 domain-containing protein [Acidipila sp. EB88]
MQRRNFLKTASWAGLAQLSGISPLRTMSALAQATSPNDYKAIVCLFMRGGNDSNNMIVPIGGSQYSAYSQVRGSNAIAQNQLLALANSSLGLNAAFPNLNRAYIAGDAAFIANVGPLVQPTTKAQYLATSVQIPQQLMAHDNQQNAWESGAYVPGVGTSWSGLTSDLMAASYNSANMPMVTIVGNATNFGRGVASTPFNAGPNAQQESFWCNEGNACNARMTAAQQLLTFNNGANLLQADQQIYQSAYKYNAFYNSVLGSASGFSTSFPSSNPLSSALYTVATMMQLRNQIGARRQIFLIDVPNSFDTHADQADIQPGLYAMIDQFIGTFVSVMQEMGLYNDVTLFTASDFSRTLQMNSAGGSDHAWGGHHFVVGGAVKGGKVYGTFPSLTLNGADDIDGTGRFVPTTALSQYTATLASWFGVPSSQLGAMLPGLSNFSTANLGFV